jgi:crossover junction endodeoxyribonuclease RuvC
MLILGIDPGTATTGYGLIHEDQGGTLMAVEYGVITTPAQTAMPNRLWQIYQELTGLIARHQPEEAAIEQLFFGKNVTTGIMVAQARGVILLAIAQAGLSVTEYKPKEIKLSVAGYGSADKIQMQVMIQQLLNLPAPPRPDDAADALAVAITHLNATRFERLI